MAQATANLSVNATNYIRLYFSTNVQQITTPTVSMKWTQGFQDECFLVFRHDALPASLQFKKLLGMRFVFTPAAGAKIYSQFYIYATKDYDPSTLSYSNIPYASTSPLGSAVFSVNGDDPQAPLTISSAEDGDLARMAARAGGIVLRTQRAFMALENPEICTQAFSTAAYRPYVAIVYDDAVTVTSQVQQENCPTGGHVDRKTAQTFQWTLEPQGGLICAGDFTQSSARLFWKLDTDANYTAVTISGTTKSVTIPANTFPAGTIQWYIQATDDQGTTTSTPVYSFTTDDATTYAYPTSPSGTIVDGSSPIVFSWTTANNYGSEPSASELQYSEDGAVWVNLATVSGNGVSYTAAAGTLPSGTLWWRVRSYNQDNVAGPWSSGVMIRNVAAPPAPNVRADAVPFAVIRWNSSGQQGYRVTVDGVDYGVKFGMDKSFALTKPLEDGTHSASVIVQNSFGLWSQPGSVEFQILNEDEGETLTLSSAFGDYENALSWGEIPSAAAYHVYRDEELVVSIHEPVWKDRFAAGAHSYQVLAQLASGNYVRSNIVSGGNPVETPGIALMSGGGWLPLRLSEMSISQQQFNYNRTATARHIAGAVYPVLELSPFEDETANYDVAFTDPEEIQAFDAMRGKVVILKTRGDNVMIGALTQVNKVVGDFYTSFTFAIQRIHWEDER